jgi:hypothetical protein
MTAICSEDRGSINTPGLNCRWNNHEHLTRRKRGHIARLTRREGLARRAVLATRERYDRKLWIVGKSARLARRAA